MCLQFLLLLEFSSSLLPLALPTLASVNSGHSVNSETVGAMSRIGTWVISRIIHADEYS